MASAFDALIGPPGAPAGWTPPPPAAATATTPPAQPAAAPGAPGAQPAATPSATPDTPQDPQAMVQDAMAGGDSITGPLVESALGGAAEGLFQAKDFFLGKQGAPSAIRSGIEDNTKALTEQPGVMGTANSLAAGIAQLGVGFLGVGKLTALVAGVPKLGAAIAAWPKLLEMAKVGGASAIAFDPHEANLSNFLQQYPGIQQPVLQYLAAKPEDDDALGRLKNAANNILVTGATGAALTTARASSKVLTSIVEAVKLRRMGDMPGAEAAAANAEGAVKSALKGTQDGVSQSGDSAGSGVPGGPDTASPSAADPGTPGTDLQAGTDTGSQPATGDGVQPGDSPVDGQVQPGSGTGAPGEVPGTGLEGVPGTGSTHPVPAVVPPVEWTPEEFAGALGKAKSDVAAIQDAGSYDAAQAQGHAFSNTEGLIPYQKLTDGTETADAWLGRMVESQADYINTAKRGVMSDATVDKMVTRIGNLYAIDPSTIHGMLMQAGKDAGSQVAKMDAAFTISQSAYMDAYGIMARADAGGLGSYASYAEAVAASKARMGVSMELFASARAILASGGRIVRRAQSQFNVARFAGLKANLAGMDDQAYADAVRGTMGNPKAMSDQVTPNALATVVNQATALQAANLIWGWATLTGIAASSTANLYLRPFMDFMGSHLQVGQETLAKGAADAAGNTFNDARLATAQSMRTQARKEMISTHTFMADGWYAALNAFQSGESGLSPHKLSTARLGSGPLPQPENFQWQPINGVADIMYNALSAGTMLASGGPGSVLTAPFRIHNSVQEMISTMRYRAVISAKADAEALNRGLEVGSKPYLDLTEGMVRDSFGPNGEAVDLAAKAEADSTVFRNQLLGSGSGQTWNGWPSGGAVIQQLATNFPPFKFIAPYVSVPANMFRQKVALTPGLNLLQKQYLDDLTGANGQGAQASATGRMMMGLMLGMKAIEWRMTGKMTGAGPSDHKAASSWREDGNLPYSIISQAQDGTKSYYQIDRLAPYEGPMAAWADVADMMMQGHPPPGGSPAVSPTPAMDQVQDAFNATWIATMHLLENNTALTSISSFVDAMQDESKIKGLANNVLPGMAIPASSLLKSLNPDPYLRELYGYFDGLKASIPGLSQTLPMRYDAYGDPVKVPGKFTSTRTDNGPLGNASDENYAATGHYATAPSPTQGGVDLRDITTESGQQAYARFQELAGHPKNGPSLKDALTKAVQQPAYQALTHGRPSEEGTRENALEKITGDYHQGALGALRQESPVVNKAITQRARDIMGQNMTKQQDVRAAAAQGGAKSLNELLKPYGMSLPVPGAVPAQTPQ